MGAPTALPQRSLCASPFFARTALKKSLVLRQTALAVGVRSDFGDRSGSILEAKTIHFRLFLRSDARLDEKRPTLTKHWQGVVKSRVRLAPGDPKSFENQSEGLLRTTVRTDRSKNAPRELQCALFGRSGTPRGCLRCSGSARTLPRSSRERSESVPERLGSVRKRPGSVDFGSIFTRCCLHFRSIGARLFARFCVPPASVPS